MFKFGDTENRNPNTAVPGQSCQFLEDMICTTNHYYVKKRATSVTWRQPVTWMDGWM